MTLLDLSNFGMFLFLGPIVLLAQAVDPTSVITPSLVQLGAIGVILAWITLVDIPQRNKAGAEREAVWRQQLEAERASAATREAAFQRALDKHAEALGAVAEGRDTLAAAIRDLAEELREERSARK